MDAIMKIFQELERQAKLAAEPLMVQEAELEQEVESLLDARSRRKEEVEAALASGPDPMPVSEAAALSPMTEAQSRWSRQRIVDALQISMALGPPPGLEGW